MNLTLNFDSDFPSKETHFVNAGADPIDESRDGYSASGNHISYIKSITPAKIKSNKLDYHANSENRLEAKSRICMSSRVTAHLV